MLRLPRRTSRIRLAAAILAAFTVTAAVAFHSDLADQNQFVHFFKNIAMTGGLLQVATYGAGAISIDDRRSQNTARA
jgi:putative oxidoreductase